MWRDKEVWRSPLLRNITLLLALPCHWGRKREKAFGWSQPVCSSVLLGLVIQGFKPAFFSFLPLPMLGSPRLILVFSFSPTKPGNLLSPSPASLSISDHQERSKPLSTKTYSFREVVPTNWKDPRPTCGLGPAPHHVPQSELWASPLNISYFPSELGWRSFKRDFSVLLFVWQTIRNLTSFSLKPCSHYLGTGIEFGGPNFCTWSQMKTKFWFNQVKVGYSDQEVISCLLSITMSL
jgi:hypothetical protein